MRITDLEPRRHAPPPDWPAETFARVTDAIATALVAAVRQAADEPAAAVADADPSGVPAP